MKALRVMLSDLYMFFEPLDTLLSPGTLLNQVLEEYKEKSD
jgi:hypothetical protein